MATRSVGSEPTERRRSRHQKKLESTRSRIRAAEAELAELEEELGQTDRPDDWQHLQDLTTQKKQLEEEILELYTNLERLEATGRG